MSKWARKKDKNHSEVQKNLEKMGYQVKDVSMFSGLGCDLLASRLSDPTGDVWLIEIKSPDASKARKLGTEAEQELGKLFPDRYRILERAEDAPKLLIKGKH